MHFVRWLACLCCVLGLSGCATTYHSARNPILGITGGYWDEPGPGQLEKVGFSGNGYSGRDTVVPYIMYHCAELAEQRHKPYFRIYHTLVDAIRDKPIEEAAVDRVGSDLGGWVFVLFDDAQEPGDISTRSALSKYGQVVHPQAQGKSA